MNDPTDPIQSLERVPQGSTDLSGMPLEPHLPKDYRQRFYDISQHPAFSDTIFAHIANGGTLITLAEVWGVRHSDIVGYISEHQEFKDRYDFAIKARDEWEKERCLQELRSIATVDIRQAYNKDGSLKSIVDMPPQLAAALQSIEVDEMFEGSGDERQQVGITRKVKFWDKAKAIELFMKKHGLLVDRVKVQQVRTLEDIVGDSYSEVVEAELVHEKNVDKSSEGVGGVGGIKTESPSA